MLVVKFDQIATNLSILFPCQNFALYGMPMVDINLCDATIKVDVSNFMRNVNQQNNYDSLSPLKLS